MPLSELKTPRQLCLVIDAAGQYMGQVYIPRDADGVQMQFTYPLPVAAAHERVSEKQPMPPPTYFSRLNFDHPSGRPSFSLLVEERP